MTPEQILRYDVAVALVLAAPSVMLTATFVSAAI